MKPFSLTAVLDHRKRLLDQAKGRFAEAQARYQEMKRQADECQRERDGLLVELEAIQRRGVDIDEYIRYINRIELLKTQLSRLQQQVRKKHEIVLRERTFLMQKGKEYRVLEKLKDRQDSAWRQFLDKKEAQMLDEIAILAKHR